MDVHNTCLVIAILSLTVSAVVIWSAFARPRDGGGSTRNKANIKNTLRALHPDLGQDPSTVENDVILRFVSSTHGEPGGRRNLDNYFMGGYLLDRDKYHQEYTHSYLSILPFFHDAGGQFESCLLSTALAHRQAVSPRMTTWNRLKWDQSSQGVFKFKHKFKVHFGEASFGACHSAGRSGRGYQPSSAAEESVQQQKSASAAGGLNRCGHAFIMQDPLTLVIADLTECFLSPRRNALCQLVHDGKTSVEEWVAARGSVVFKNILFHSELCQNMTPYNAPKSQLHNSEVRSPQELCEGAHTAFVNQLGPHTGDLLASFIIENLQNWFSVVGIFEDFVNSLTMLNHVFRFPLHECDFLTSFRNPLSHKTTWNVTTTWRQGVQNNSGKHSPPPRFEESQYENMASLSEFPDDSSSTGSWLQALSRIENSLPWGKKSRTKPLSQSDHRHTSPPQLDDSFPHGGGQNQLEQNNYSFTDSGLNKDTLILSPDKHQNTLSAGPDTTSRQIKNSLPGSELYLEDLAGKNASAHADGSEGGGHEDVDRSMDDVVSEQTISWRAKTLPADAAVGRLYKRFMKSLTIRQSLAADLRIYEATKRLYTAQKQLFFNSIKST